MDRRALRKAPYGLELVTAVTKDGRKVGCVANTFVQVASDPARALVSLNKDNATAAAIKETKAFDVALFSEKANMDVIGVFGFQSSLEVDKFESFKYDIDEAGIPYLTEYTCAHFLVRVEQVLDAGSHWVFCGTVEQAEVLSDDVPLTYEYYHRVLKGKTPPKAASYVEETIEEEEAPSDDKGEKGSSRYAWQCTICGHIEYVDELPDDFQCPICGVGKEFFKRIEL